MATDLRESLLVALSIAYVLCYWGREGGEHVPLVRAYLEMWDERLGWGTEV